MTKISPKPNNDQNIPKTPKMTKIPPKPKNYQNTPKTQKCLQNLKMTKIPPSKKPKNDQNILEESLNDQNTLKTQ